MQFIDQAEVDVQGAMVEMGSLPFAVKSMSPRGDHLAAMEAMAARLC